MELLMKELTFNELSNVSGGDGAFSNWTLSIPFYSADKPEDKKPVNGSDTCPRPSIVDIFNDIIVVK